jgi:hypothetical protein
MPVFCMPEIGHTYYFAYSTAYLFHFFLHMLQILYMKKAYASVHILHIIPHILDIVLHIVHTILHIMYTKYAYVHILHIILHILHIDLHILHTILHSLYIKKG